MSMAPTQVCNNTESKPSPSLIRYSEQTLEAMTEARRISKESDVPGYTSMDTLKEALEG